jgi:hypothetical protein
MYRVGQGAYPVRGVPIVTQHKYVDVQAAHLEIVEQHPGDMVERGGHPEPVGRGSGGGLVAAVEVDGGVAEWGEPGGVGVVAVGGEVVEGSSMMLMMMMMPRVSSWFSCPTW